jgi:ribosomal protein S18 acetylase RimI-like enzyme
MLQTGELDPAGLLVLRRDGAVTAATAVTVLPGGSGLVWPPQAIEGLQQRLDEDRLAKHLMTWLQEHGACLAQALLPAEQLHLAEPLLRAGFEHITGLWYLRHDRELSINLFQPSRLVFQPYPDVAALLFQQTMARTFEGTLDCPEVTTARPVEMVLAGFQNQGIFDPQNWWLAHEDNEPAGVLIMCALPDSDTWEICYVGVVPERRRRGLGREMMIKALLEAKAAGVGEVFLTVDARNKPAWELYLNLGFQPFDRREVFLALL